MTLPELLDTYRQQLGEGFPLFAVGGRPDVVRRLCRLALERRRPVTYDECLVAAGGEPLPEGAVS
jgi:hypothetical protein